MEKLYKCRQVLAFDYNQSMLITTRNKCAELKNVNFAQASVTHIPLPDNSVELVFCLRMMHHIDTTDLFNHIVGELARVSSKWMAISFYRNESWKNIRRRILRRRVSGYPISVLTFFKILKKYPFRLQKIFFLRNSQTLVLLKKNSPEFGVL